MTTEPTDLQRIERLLEEQIEQVERCPAEPHLPSLYTSYRRALDALKLAVHRMNMVGTLPAKERTWLEMSNTHILAILEGKTE